METASYRLKRKSQAERKRDIAMERAAKMEALHDELMRCSDYRNLSPQQQALAVERIQTLRDRLSIQKASESRNGVDVSSELKTVGLALGALAAGIAAAPTVAAGAAALAAMSPAAAALAAAVGVTIAANMIRQERPSPDAAGDKADVSRSRGPNYFAGRPEAKPEDGEEMRVAFRAEEMGRQADLVFTLWKDGKVKMENVDPKTGIPFSYGDEAATLKYDPQDESVTLTWRDRDGKLTRDNDASLVTILKDADRANEVFSLNGNVMHKQEWGAKISDLQAEGANLALSAPRTAYTERDDPR